MVTVVMQEMTKMTCVRSDESDRSYALAYVDKIDKIFIAMQPAVEMIHITR